MNSPPDDTELMLRFKRSQDREAFGELVRRHQKPLINFFYRLTWNQTGAEDLAQEVFIKLVEAAHHYEPRAKFTTFLYRIARNHWIDKLRRKDIGAISVSLDSPLDKDEGKALNELIAGKTIASFETTAQAESIAHIKELIITLPEEQQMILNLTYFEEMSYAEVAEILDIPLGTVKSRLHAAITRLKDLLVS